MNLFENAICSIKIGLNEYQFNSRLISSVRNIYAGILLLFKHKLILMSDKNSNAALIKQQIVPTINEDGTITWKGIGNKTVDVAGIKTRFKSLEIHVEWDTFDRISRHRNEIEHFYSQLSANDTVQLLSDCFIIINNFLSHHLKMDAKNVLGDEAWRILLEAHEVYEFELEKNIRSINNLTFHHKILNKIFLEFQCITCGSHLIEPKTKRVRAEYTDFCCAECQSSYSYDEICNFGILDLNANSIQSTHEKSNRLFSNCEECEQGLYLITHRVCTACGCLD
ncbi:hypothetical protein N8H72_27885 [Pseudomonas koreensis]|uniref:hypothetical protein n=1 Tax=Pseudomonas koreensis TaxID=198620 RepID=UPI0021C9AE24|nr:hypothetical protein [Pseudomonas koreensis]MCU0093822.1 hypothetical protein [Pseudomonas koreensis]